jgi:hypothetical protein
MNKSIKCLICLDDIKSNDIDFLPCIHAFHKICIDTWINEKPECPVCKVPVYINTANQLSQYNACKKIHDTRTQNEAMYFQRISAGELDNLIPTPVININTPITDELTNHLNDSDLPALEPAQHLHNNRIVCPEMQVHLDRLSQLGYMVSILDIVVAAVDNVAADTDNE